MEIPDDVVKKAWERAGGQCECTKRNHAHFYVPCAKPLILEHRGKLGWGGWEVKLKNEFKEGTLDNCEIVCMTCFESKY